MIHWTSLRPAGGHDATRLGRIHIVVSVGCVLRESTEYRVDGYLAEQGPDMFTDVRADGTQEKSLHL